MFPTYFQYPDFASIQYYDDLNDRLPANPQDYPDGGYTDPAIASNQYRPVAYGRVDEFPGTWYYSGMQTAGSGYSIGFPEPPIGYFGSVPPVHPPFLTIKSVLSPY
jgi:hypothetical protein